jgi:alkanesulfonate monooxygenase SsuD/methylene tetrahydromethanopterin reductase-like flavin-dependent oxidoreductase (luciferase family)
MKLDVFCETQKAAPITPDHEQRVYAETLAQAEHADALGFDTWWSVEHHGALEFSWSSAPEVLLAWIATRTKRIHLGHAGVLAPFKINHPLRVAERLALLDHISGGRAELGLARTGAGEWDTFQVDPNTSRQQLVEAMRMIPKMWTQQEFSWNSELLKIPPRNVIPKPLQQPHPRLWQTCSSPESFRLAGRLGVGSLGTTLLTELGPMAALLKEHRDGLGEIEEPAGHFVNREAGVFTFVHAAETTKQAIASGAALGAIWYVAAAPRVFHATPEIWYSQIRGNFLPNDPAAQRSLALGGGVATEIPIEKDHPVVQVLRRYAAGERISNEEAYEVLLPVPSVIIGDVATCKRKMEAYREIGATRLLCMFQYADIAHEHVLAGMATTAKHLIPAFAD